MKVYKLKPTSKFYEFLEMNDQFITHGVFCTVFLEPKKMLCVYFQPLTVTVLEDIKYFLIFMPKQILLT